ncbi:MAG: wax ester/triacylglycerol synthase family O-acyltransferase [Burkholderiales bacterium]|nr:wax ester/triacylglycerol synthase family O-acyltransferase [Burkholderiales bacterium]
MHQLSGLDASFLYLESPQMPMHVGALHVMELPKGYKGHYVDDLRQLVAARLPLMPALRRRLWWMPLNLANPAWVDAEPDLKQHIVSIKLPAAAKQGDGLAALEATVGELHPQLLDRRRPLWKFHLLEGLAPAANGCKRVGIYSQLHHAAVDGQAAVVLANILFDVTPEPRQIALRESKRARHFSLDMAEMLRGALGQEALQVGRIIRDLPATAGTLGKAAGQVLSHTRLLGGAKAGAVSNLGLAPRTLLNVSVTEGRAFATLSLPLPALRTTAKAHGASLNDVLLMVCSGGMRRYWQAKRLALPRKSMVAAVPISLRAAGDTGTDNQVSMSFISLGTHLADTRRRWAHIRAATSAMKATMGRLKSVLPTDFPSIGMPWLMEAAASLYGKAKVAEKVPQIANVVISNVPGPTVPLYFAGARLTTNFPTSIVVHGMALNITAQSIDQQLDIGFMADAAAMPDVAVLAQAVDEAWQELQALPAAVAKVTASPRASPPKRKRAAG